MRPTFRTILAGVTAAGLMGGTALAQQVILVPGPDAQAGGQTSGQAGGQGASGDAQEQRFLLVPAPRFAPGRDAQAGADSSMAMELYRRGYRQGVSDAERAGASQQRIDPAAIERIGRELFERGYVLGMMQGQMQADQQQVGTEQSGQSGQSDAQASDQQSSTQGDKQGDDRQAAAGQSGQNADEQLVERQVGKTPQTDVPEATIRAESSEQHGRHLVDANGRPVYMFTADTRGSGDANASSACRDDCAKAWVPVLTRSTPVDAGEKVKSAMLGTLERQDGTMQVTYGGWPLYYYAKDRDADGATGQNVQAFGGEWYLVTPDGEKAGQG